jgi:hypothetical protein
LLALVVAAQVELKAKLESSASVFSSSAGIKGASNTGFDIVNLHRPTEAVKTPLTLQMTQGVFSSAVQPGQSHEQ